VPQQADTASSVAERKPGTVQSVEVALQILEGIADNDGLVRVNELARQLGMTKARVSRHMQTLLALGLVARGRHEGYTFGWKLLQLSRAAVRDRSLVDLAKPHMQTLRDEVNHSVILSLPAPDGAVVISSVESRAMETVTVRIAGFLPSPSSPAGRLSVALQHGADAGARKLLQQWPHQGVEYEADTGRGVGGIAAPVFDEHRSLIAVVSIVAPAASLLPTPSPSVLSALQRCVRQIELDHMR
jgi:DNA-binding IclR family transcriptional regulator